MKHQDKTTAALEAEIAILERKKVITEEQIAIRRRELARRERESSLLKGRGCFSRRTPAVAVAWMDASARVARTYSSA